MWPSVEDLVPHPDSVMSAFNRDLNFKERPQTLVRGPDSKK